MAEYYNGIKRNGIKRDEHRLIMEAHIGRTLERHEVVHHINGNIKDNRIENLQIMSLSQHSRMHRTGTTLAETTRQKLSEVHSGRPRKDLRKLSDTQIIEAIQRRDQGESYRSIGRGFNISHAAVRESIERFQMEANP